MRELLKERAFVAHTKLIVGSGFGTRDRCNTREVFSSQKQKKQDKNHYTLSINQRQRQLIV